MIIQLRCVQLEEALVHSMPKFGNFRLNGERKTHQSFKVGDPPNDRKRKDKVMDLTQVICSDLKPLKSTQGLPQIYSLELMHRTKHDGDKNLWYVAGLFFCKTF